MLRGSEPPVYDRIGVRYAATRRPDPRIAGAIVAALGDARTVVNVGAGAGAYEPADRTVVAVEPSRTMVVQRPRRAAPCIQGVAEQLPFRDRSLDASLGILTIHHWVDRAAGLGELRRVARRRVVLLTWDPDGCRDFWLTAEYLPEIMDLDRPRFPPVATLEEKPRRDPVIPVPVPHDCPGRIPGRVLRRPEDTSIPTSAATSRHSRRWRRHARRDSRGSPTIPVGTIEGAPRALRGRESSCDVGYRRARRRRAGLAPISDAQARP